MAISYNPSISEEPRNQRTAPVNRATAETILGWLDRTGRLMPHDTDTAQKETEIADAESFDATLDNT